MTAIKNLLKGIMALLYNAVISIMIPLIVFNVISEYYIAGIYITLTESQYQIIIFWIVSFGLLLCATAFFAASAPARSRRKGVMELLQIIINSAYMFMYKFSGASVLVFELAGEQNYNGFIELDMTKLVILWMGLIFCNIVVAAIDLIDYILVREEKPIDKKSKRKNETHIENKDYEPVWKSKIENEVQTIPTNPPDIISKNITDSQPWSSPSIPQTAPSSNGFDVSKFSSSQSSQKDGNFDVMKFTRPGVQSESDKNMYDSQEKEEVDE